MNDTPIVEFTNVCKNYQRGDNVVKVLSDLNLKIEAGQFLALMGPSGSGKSTMLNLMGGLDQPSSGCVIIEGENITALSESKLAEWRSHSVGFVFQSFNLLPTLTAHANVELPLLLSDMSASERAERADIALEVVGLKERRLHKPRELSGGQEQRVAIARAIVNDPALLLCDEPTGDLDRENADNILAILNSLNQRQGKTIVMVTHDQAAADAAKEIMVMEKGAPIAN